VGCSGSGVLGKRFVLGVLPAASGPLPIPNSGTHPSAPALPPSWGGRSGYLVELPWDLDDQHTDLAELGPDLGEQPMDLSELGRNVGELSPDLDDQHTDLAELGPDLDEQPMDLSELGPDLDEQPMDLSELDPDLDEPCTRCATQAVARAERFQAVDVNRHGPSFFMSKTRTSGPLPDEANARRMLLRPSPRVPSTKRKPP
jgi:hypothetical protein